MAWKIGQTKTVDVGEGASVTVRGLTAVESAKATEAAFSGKEHDTAQAAAYGVELARYGIIKGDGFVDKNNKPIPPEEMTGERIVNTPGLDKVAQKAGEAILNLSTISDEVKKT